MSSSSSVSLAILDDYGGIAPKHFEHITGLKVDSYPETLNPAKPDGLEGLVKRLRPYQIISTMRERTPMPAELQKQLPDLKLLLTTGLRNAAFDMQSATDRGIVVTGAKGGPPKDSSTFPGGDLPPPAQYTSVNQHAWALLLSLCSRLPVDDNAVKSDPHAWQSGYIIPIGGKTLGLAGLGKLGALMAKTGVVFGMKIIAWSENLTQEKADAAAENDGFAKGTYKAVTKEELFKQSDVLSVHYVLSARSKGLIGSKELGMMKTSAVLVNTSRGPLIDEAALLHTLTEGGIRGAALDVYDEEPLPPDSPWRSSRDFKSEVVLSPHMGYVNSGTMERWYQEQAENVERWLKGEELLNKMN